MGLFVVATSEVIRPSAVLDERTASRVLAWMRQNDVGRGGRWLPSASLWQRFDAPFDGPPNAERGNARLLGSIAVVYGQPGRHDITIYKVTITRYGVDSGWDVSRLCDDALACVNLTLATVPRTRLEAPPRRDPFHVHQPPARNEGTA